MRVWISFAKTIQYRQRMNHVAERARLDDQNSLEFMVRQHLHQQFDLLVESTA
jgi:hypothetical protein